MPLPDTDVPSFIPHDSSKNSKPLFSVFQSSVVIAHVLKPRLLELSLTFSEVQKCEVYKAGVCICIYKYVYVNAYLYMQIQVILVG